MACGNSAMRAISFIAACLVITFSWVTYSAPKLGPPFKQIFNLQQTELELIYSMSFCGIMGSLLTGPLIQALGLFWGSLFNAVTSATVYLLIGFAFDDIDFYKERIELFAFYWFLAGTCAATILVLATKACIQNFSTEVTATVNGVLTTAMSVGPFLVNIIWDYGFQHNLKPFFICMAAVNGGLNLFCMVTYGKYYDDAALVNTAYDDDENFDEQPSFTDVESDEEEQLLNNKHTTYNSTRQHAAKTKTEDIQVEFEGGMSVCSTIKTWYFWIFLFMCFVVQGHDITTIINVTILSESMHLDAYTWYLPYMNSVLGMIMKPFVGWISDATQYVIPHIVYILLSVLINIVVMILAIFMLDHFSVFCLYQFQCNLSFYIVSNNLPTLLNQEFGSQFLTRNYSFCLGAWGLGCLVLQTLFGYVYSFGIHPIPSPTHSPGIGNIHGNSTSGIYTANSYLNYTLHSTDVTTNNPIPGEEVCYGLDCFKLTHWVSISLHVILVFLLLIYVKFQFCKEGGTRDRFYKIPSETGRKHQLTKSRSELIAHVKSSNLMK